MAHDSSGLKGILELPFFYNFFQRLIGSRQMKAILARDYFKVSAGENFLDIGCGTGENLHFLPAATNFVGIDFNEGYIRNAERCFGSRARFILGDLATYSFGNQKFDCACVVGVLHHLDDEQVDSILAKVRDLLSPGGKLVCVENVHTPDLSGFERFMLRMDRGKNIRTKAGYTHLVQKYFSSVASEFRTDLLRIPYTHIIFTCQNST